MHSGSGPGGGGGGGSMLYEGRRSRKPVVRKTIDTHASIIRHLQQRFYQPPLHPQLYLPPSADALPFLSTATPSFTPVHPLPSPALGFCTKYVTQSINKQRTSILCCSFTPEHKRVVTGAASGELTLWNALTFNFETILQGHDDAIRCMAWGGEGGSAVLATGDDSGIIKYWQVSMNNLKAIKAHKATVRDVCFSPHSGGSKLGSCSDDHSISVWDVEYSKEEVGISGHGWDVKSLHWHPFAAALATGSKDNSIRVWDARTGKEELSLLGHKNTVNAVRFNANGHWLASGGRDRVVKIWDWRQQRELSTHRVADKEVTAVCWHPTVEQTLVSASYDGDIKYWVVGEEEAAAEISAAHDKEVNDLCFHELGHLLVSVSSDQLTRYWARNKPGDEMADKYNVKALGGGRRVDAMLELREAQMMNPFTARQQGRGVDAVDAAAGWAAAAAGAAGASRGDAAAGSVPLGFADSGRALVEERERVGRERAEDRKRDWERDRERVERENNMSERERFEREIQERERQRMMRGGRR